MIKIGQINTLKVDRETESGFYLEDLEKTEEVFMPPGLAPKDIEVGSTIDVFVYHDTTGSFVATSKFPKACVGEYAVMTVVEMNGQTAFTDWGIEKDLMIPLTEQKYKLRKGDTQIVRICLEENKERVYGTTKLGRFIREQVVDLKEKDKVTIIPGKKFEVGYRVVVNKKFLGMIYHNEIFEEITLGKEYQGIVKSVREDSLIDISLQAQGMRHLKDSKGKILQFLKENGGHSELNDKSDPEAIYKSLKMSKKAFKKTIGMLYKARQIEIKKDGISLL